MFVLVWFCLVRSVLVWFCLVQFGLVLVRFDTVHFLCIIMCRNSTKNQGRITRNFIRSRKMYMCIMFIKEEVWRAMFLTSHLSIDGCLFYCHLYVQEHRPSI